MKPKIAILGTRGIPANYGGFETFTEELSTRLVKRGYPVCVYCRRGNSDYKEPQYRGVKLITLSTIKHKYFDTIAHTFFSVWHVSFSDVKIIYMCNSINSIFAIVPRIFGKKVIINVDGLEWKRAKWNKLGKLAYQISEWISTIVGHVVISDSKAIQKYYMDRFKRETVNISYGAQKKDGATSDEILKKHGLQNRNYILYVSRLEPENNALIMLQAYAKVKTDMPLVIVGSAPYGKPYFQKLRETADERVKFLGGIYGEDYYSLQSHAYIYLHGNEVGGTNPALLEAMVYSNCVVSIGVPFNREVVGDAGICFEPGNVNDLQKKLFDLLADPVAVERYRTAAFERVNKLYQWDMVVDQYEELFDKMTTKK
ncbi:MAG: DUF1972 domain-containing protein [Candidatus Omnitrophica bacterium]|nr:DUF1972 domain-containing protein [Candidatus Omnitrophota bacterium]